MGEPQRFGPEFDVMTLLCAYCDDGGETRVSCGLESDGTVLVWCERHGERLLSLPPSAKSIQLAAVLFANDGVEAEVH